MNYTGEHAVNQLLRSYQRFYNITRFDGIESPVPDDENSLQEAKKISPFPENNGASLSAVCEYYERTGQHLFFKTNEIWSANQEEFIFLFKVDHLNDELFEKCKNYAHEEGLKLSLIHI